MPSKLVLDRDSKFLKCAKECLFLWAEVNRHTLWVPSREPRCPARFFITLVNVALQSSNHDFADAAFLFTREVRCARETHWVELLEKPREATSVAIMRCRGKKKLMLEEGGDDMEHLREIAVVPKIRGR